MDTDVLKHLDSVVVLLILSLSALFLVFIGHNIFSPKLSDAVTYEVNLNRQDSVDFILFSKSRPCRDSAYWLKNVESRINTNVTSMLFQRDFCLLFVSIRPINIKSIETNQHISYIRTLNEMKYKIAGQSAQDRLLLFSDEDLLVIFFLFFIVLLTYIWARIEDVIDHQPVVNYVVKTISGADSYEQLWQRKLELRAARSVNNSYSLRVKALLYELAIQRRAMNKKLKRMSDYIKSKEENDEKTG